METVSQNGCDIHGLAKVYLISIDFSFLHYAENLKSEANGLSSFDLLAQITLQIKLFTSSISYG